MDFWSRVQEAIERENTSYAYLAQKLGKRESTVSGWHRGKKKIIPAADYAVVIAQTLNTTVEYLVAGTPPEGVPHDILDLAKEIVQLGPVDQEEIKVLIRHKLKVKNLVTTIAVESPSLTVPEREESPVIEVREPEPEYSPGPPAIDISPYRPPADIQDYLTGELVLLPFYGEVAAGKPIEINPYTDKSYPFPSPLLRGSPKSYFVVRLRGTSMIEAGLNDGELVVIREAEEPENGKIMLVRYESASTLKRIRVEGKTIYLCWEDGSGEVRMIDTNDYQVQGEFFRKLEG
jgi:repressor LexA